MGSLLWTLQKANIDVFGSVFPEVDRFFQNFFGEGRAGMPVNAHAVHQCIWIADNGGTGVAKLMFHRKMNKNFRFRFSVQTKVSRFCEMVTSYMRFVFGQRELIGTIALPKRTGKAMEWSFVSADKCNVQRYGYGIISACMRF